MLFFSAPSFQTMHLLCTISFHHKTRVVFFPQHFFANSTPTMHTLKTINMSSNMSVEVPQTKNHFTRVLQIPLICHVIKKLCHKDKKLYMGFVDIEKAFNRVSRKVMQWMIRKISLPEISVRAVMRLDHRAKMEVKVGSE